MPVTITHLASLSTSLCGRLGPDLTSTVIPKRISHEYGRYSDVANSLAFTETIDYWSRAPDLYGQSSESTTIWKLNSFELILGDCKVEFRDVANFDAVWLPQWRRAETRAYGAKKYGKSNGHAQKAVMVQRGQVVGTRNTSVCSENVSSVFSYWLFSIQSYKISQRSYAWVHNDISQ